MKVNGRRGGELSRREVVNNGAAVAERPRASESVASPPNQLVPGGWREGMTSSASFDHLIADAQREKEAAMGKMVQDQAFYHYQQQQQPRMHSTNPINQFHAQYPTASNGRQNAHYFAGAMKQHGGNHMPSAAGNAWPHHQQVPSTGAAAGAYPPLPHMQSQAGEARGEAPGVVHHSQPPHHHHHQVAMAYMQQSSGYPGAGHQSTRHPQAAATHGGSQMNDRYPQQGPGYHHPSHGSSGPQQQPHLPVPMYQGYPANVAVDPNVRQRLKERQMMRVSHPVGLSGECHFKFICNQLFVRNALAVGL